MAEYIDRDALLERLRFKRNSEKHPREKLIGLQSAIAQVYKFPTADVVEVRHGEWVEFPEDWRMQMVGDKCSICGWAIFGGVSEFHYCPNCGAKMDGKGEVNEVN